LDLSNGLGLRLQKEKSSENPTFLLVVLRDIRPADLSKINLLEHFKAFSFGIFGKLFSNQNLVEQGKDQLLVENRAIFAL
jgi:hypothetical protein